MASEKSGGGKTLRDSGNADDLRETGQGRGVQKTQATDVTSEKLVNSGDRRESMKQTQGNQRKRAAVGVTSEKSDSPAGSQSYRKGADAPGKAEYGARTW